MSQKRDMKHPDYAATSEKQIPFGDDNKKGKNNNNNARTTTKQEQQQQSKNNSNKARTTAKAKTAPGWRGLELRWNKVFLLRVSGLRWPAR